MRERSMLWIAWGLVAGVAALPISLAAATPPVAFAGPVELRVDNLKTPLGIDDTAPRFSWQLQDPARGARQTAYEVQVASRPELLQTGQADVWDSGRMQSGQSLHIVYGGPALQPSTRYYWRVLAWDAAGKPYAESAPHWWETGLLRQENWRAQWIGYETAEESAVRHSGAAWIVSPDAQAAKADKAAERHFAYRTTVTLAKPVRRATLFATAEDTVSAWVNGAQALTADPLPAWRQMPWKKYVRADVTGKLSAGANSIAIDAVHYVVNGGDATDTPPMSATLFVEYEDGTTAAFATGTEWKTAIDFPEGGAAADWRLQSFDDSGWKNAALWTQGPQ